MQELTWMRAHWSHIGLFRNWTSQHEVFVLIRCLKPGNACETALSHPCHQVLWDEKNARKCEINQGNKVSGDHTMMRASILWCRFSKLWSLLQYIKGKWIMWLEYWPVMRNLGLRLVMARASCFMDSCEHLHIRILVGFFNKWRGECLTVDGTRGIPIIMRNWIARRRKLAVYVSNITEDYATRSMAFLPKMGSLCDFPPARSNNPELILN